MEIQEQFVQLIPAIACPIVKSSKWIRQVFFGVQKNEEQSH